MRLLEELQMNALPSLQTILYDGWILRFADGYSNRANSINPIYQSQENINDKILQCEKIFRSRNLNPTYKITPFVFPENLDELLNNRGYKTINQTSVQTLNLGNGFDLPSKAVNLCNNVEPPSKVAIVHSASKNNWFESYCKFNKISTKNCITYEKMLSNLIPKAFYSSILMNDETIGCGMAVQEKGYIGLFDIVVSEQHRKNGYGMRLLLSMLKEGREQGAEYAYLQVMFNNTPAVSLYRKLGFKEQYQYHYRVLTD